MIQLSVSAACVYVRRILDELTSVEDIGMLASPDAVDLHRIVEGSVVEAVYRTHSAAPSLLIDGVKAEDDDYTAELDNDGVITITLNKDVCRIASVQTDDSNIVVSDLIPEDSAEGRKQLNTHVRGVPDDPRLVLCKVWADNHKPVLRYYSTDAKTLPEITMTYVPYPVIEETIVLICPRLEYAVLNEIAAMVLDSLDLHDKAEIYRTKAKENMEGK